MYYSGHGRNRLRRQFKSETKISSTFMIGPLRCYRAMSSFLFVAEKVQSACISFGLRVGTCRSSTTTKRTLTLWVACFARGLQGKHVIRVSRFMVHARLRDCVRFLDTYPFTRMRMFNSVAPGTYAAALL